MVEENLSSEENPKEKIIIITTIIIVHGVTQMLCNNYFTMINETTNVCVEENNWENQQERERERESRTFWTMKEKEDLKKKEMVKRRQRR
jgi:hypothetical protein